MNSKQYKQETKIGEVMEKLVRVHWYPATVSNKNEL